MRPEQLREIFGRHRNTSADNLAAAMTRLLERAKATWPGISAGDEEFARYLADRAGGKQDIVDWLGRADPDLYLAWACIRGDPSALALFEHRLVPLIQSAVATIDNSHAFVSEVLQQIRQKLLIRDGQRGLKLAEYAGLGPLSHWLRAVAVRTALNQRRTQLRQDTPVDDEVLQKKIPTESGDLELQFLKEKYRGDFTEAFRKALGRLDLEERTLLRLCFMEELTLAQIGVVYGADKSTISRRLAKCRRILLDYTSEELTRALNLHRSEAESLLNAVQSQMNLSLRSLFKSDSDL